jgi:short-subunit dehydrogenase
MSNKEFFKDKIIWVTGASSGIGEALTKRLVSWDAKLIISSNRTDELERVKNECGVQGDKIVILPVDLSIPSDVEKAADDAVKIHGHIDILFNNGGISQRSLATETSIETDRKIMEINYFSGIIITKKLLPSMIARGSGHIVTTSSLTGKFGLPYRSAYAASKHAIAGYYESVWMEFHNKGIRTTVVFPGPVKTNISYEAIGPDGKPFGKMDDLQTTGISPEKCVTDILNGVRKNQREIFTGKSELRAVWIKRFFPGMFFKMIVRKNRV